jgi:selenocysteine lyase/cysteine desulfurase
MACAQALERMDFRVFSGPHQAATVSFLPKIDCEEAAQILSRQGIAIRAGLHCAPLAHESVGTLDTGTVRVSFGHNCAPWQNGSLRFALEKFLEKRGKTGSYLH